MYVYILYVWILDISNNVLVENKDLMLVNNLINKITMIMHILAFGDINIYKQLVLEVFESVMILLNDGLHWVSSAIIKGLQNL